MRNRILIYLRKSNMQGADNNLPAHLERMLKLVVTLNGTFNPESDVYQEPEGRRSAQSEKQRPAYREMMRRVNAKDSDVRWILGNDRARMWRDKDEYGLWLKNIKKLGVEFIPATEAPIQDIDTAIGMASEGMMGIMNAFYSKYVGEKRRGQYEALRERTWYVATKTPSGTRSDGKGMNRRVVVSDETYPVGDGERRFIDSVIEFFRVYSANEWGVRECARHLNDNGYLWKHGRRAVRVKPATLVRVLKLARLYYEIGALDKNLYHRVMRTIEQRKNPSASNRVGHEPLMLSRILFCANCGCMFTAENRGEYYNSLYRHQLNACRWGASVSARFVDGLFLKQMREVGEYTPEEIDSLLAHLRSGKDNAIDYSTKRERLNTMLRNLETAYLAGDLGELVTARPHYLARRSEIQKELNEIPSVVEVEYDEDEIRSSLSHFLEFIEDVHAGAPHKLNGVVRSFVERVELDMETRKLNLFWVGQSVVPR